MLPVRVLVVDDSVVARKLLCEALASSPGITVAGTASGGAIALAKIPQLNPDIITLDIEMPGLDGIQTLAEIRKRYPKLPVIMCSTLTERGAAITLEALSLGASDYISKPCNGASPAASLEQFRQELSPKILSLVLHSGGAAWPSRVPTARKEPVSQRVAILVIGASTGGPNALAAVVPQLSVDFPVPIVIVQHMPPLFTRLLAQRLNSASPLDVREAEDGKILQPGQVWIAPGDYHVTVAQKESGVALQLNQGPLENGCRPAVDVLFRSAARVYGASVLGLVMTGMGSDGVRGARHIREAGGGVMVQDQVSSVVWGMPGAVCSAGAADSVCPLAEIKSEILRRVADSRV